MIVSIIKEPAFERRVAMMPDSVSQLILLKAEVMVEKGAGMQSFTSDDEYKDAGAVVKSRAEVLNQSDILLMIHPLQEKELAQLKDGRILIGAFNPLVDHEAVRNFSSVGITSFSLDIIPRISRAQSMDILSSQATVAGYKAVLDAANRIGGFMQMFMTAAGTIKPARVLILGAGVAGLQAIGTARRMGAVVEAFDVRTAAKEEVLSLGARFIEVEGAMDDITAGGYAVEQTEEFKKKQRQAVHEHAIRSDIIICSAQIPGKKAPVILFKETVENMSPGSVIIDLAASTGGNCELTINNEIENHNNVFIVGNSNYPSDMPADASLMFGKNMLNFVKLLINEDGSLNMNMDDEIVKGTCVTMNKKIMNERVLDSMKI